MQHISLHKLIAMFTVYKNSFSYLNVPTITTKELFVLAFNRTVVGTLMSIGGVRRDTTLYVDILIRKGNIINSYSPCNVAVNIYHSLPTLR